MTPPSFWYQSRISPRVILWVILLWPFTLVWRFGAWLKAIMATPFHPPVPVVVVGNLTAGGTGKTPLVASLAVESRRKGRHPVILMRGHGGIHHAPYRVKAGDTAHDVGDEAKWLQEFAPVVIARNRGHGARYIIDTIPECDVIIMDDGLQNPSIEASLKLAVFNGNLGVGNGMIIPAGPLRQSLRSGLDAIDAAVITGDDIGQGGVSVQKMLAAKGFKGPVFASTRHLNNADIKAISGKPVFAFAGIGYPDGFFNMLRDRGITLTGTRSFADHHPYTPAELMAMTKQAHADGAMLVTTEKDYARLSPNDQAQVTAIRLESKLDGSLLDMVMKARV